MNAIDLKATCIECGDDLVISSVTNGVQGYAEILISLAPCVGCMERAKEDEREVLENG